MKAWKLLRQRRDGTLGPLFINRRQVVTPGEWLAAEDHPTKGYARRPGWHVAPEPLAPHLSTKGRVWREVLIEQFTELVRPKSQGSKWYLAQRMMVLPSTP